jgi:hypothetical protein
MHNLDSLLADAEPRPGLVAAARRGDPWFLAFLFAVQIAVITAALLVLAHQPEPTPTPATSQQET